MSLMISIGNDGNIKVYNLSFAMKNYLNFPTSVQISTLQDIDLNKIGRDGPIHIDIECECSPLVGINQLLRYLMWIGLKAALLITFRCKSDISQFKSIITKCPIFELTIINIENVDQELFYSPTNPMLSSLRNSYRTLIALLHTELLITDHVRSLKDFLI
jgi:hypothetical protein